MATPEAESFLQDFKVKLGIWGVVFLDNRSKNTQPLLDLDIRPVDRRQILQDLRASDYHEDPLTDKLQGKADIWVFAKTIKGYEVYIKSRLV